MNKKMQKGIVAAVAATMANGIVAPVFAASAETTDLASKYAKAYEATVSAKTQKELTAARVLVDALYGEVKGTANEYLATTLSSLLDPLQQKNLVALDLAIKAADATPTQENVNKARALLVDMPKVWAEAFSSYVDGIQNELLVNADTAIKKAQASGTQADLDAAKALVDDLATATNNDTVKTWAEVTLKAELDKVVVKTVVKEVKAVGAKKLTVSFNNPVVDTAKMVLTVKRDNLTVSVASVEWNADKTVATLTTTTNIQTGNYVATAKYDAEVATVTPSVKLEAAKVGKITFASETAVITDKSAAAGDEKQAVTVKVKVENQYGEDVTNSLNTANLALATSPLSVSSSVGSAVSLNNGVLRIENTSDYTVDQNVVLTIVHKDTATVSTGTVKVAQAANVASLELSPMTTDNTSLKGKTVYVSTMTSNATDFYIPLTALDQYGNELAQADLTNVTIVSSNTSIVNPNGLTTKNNKPAIAIQAQAGTATYGTAVITVVSANGKNFSLNVEVKENAKIDVLQVEQPSVTLKQGVAATVPFTAVDQYGNALVSSSEVGGVTLSAAAPNNTATFGKGGSVSVTGGTLTTKIDYLNNNKQILQVSPTAKGTPVVVTVISATGKVQTQTWSVEAAPAVTTVSGLSADFYTVLQQGEVSDITGLINAKDQYGDSIAIGANYEIVYADTTKALADRNVTINTATEAFTASTTKEGTESFIIKLYDGVIGGASTHLIDQYTFTMESVKLANIPEFAVEDLNKQFVGVGASATYDQVVSVYGKKDGKNVQVNQNIIKNVSNDAGLSITGAAGAVATTLASTDLSASLTSGDKTGKLTVLVEGANGPVSLTKDITFSEDAPKAVSMAIKKGTTTITDAVIALNVADITDVVGAGAGTFKFDLKDQYNVASEDVTFTVTNIVDADATTLVPANTAVTISNTAATKGVVTITDAQGTAGDSFVINAITSSGLTKTIKVVLNN